MEECHEYIHRNSKLKVKIAVTSATTEGFSERGFLDASCTEFLYVYEGYNSGWQNSNRRKTVVYKFNIHGSVHRSIIQYK